MKLNLTRPFAGAAQSLPFPDPWGSGVTFHVRPSVYAPFQRALQEVTKDSGQGDFMRRAMARASKRIAAAGVEGLIKGKGAQEAVDQLDPQAIFAESFREAIEATPDEEFASAADKTLPADVVLLLVDRIEGLIDVETNTAADPHDQAVHRAVLEDEGVVTLGMPYGGQEAGRALRLWLVERANEVTKTLTTAKEVAEGESERSSASG